MALSSTPPNSSPILFINPNLQSPQPRTLPKSPAAKINFNSPTSPISLFAPTVFNSPSSPRSPHAPNNPIKLVFGLTRAASVTASTAAASSSSTSEAEANERVKRAGSLLIKRSSDHFEEVQNLLTPVLKSSTVESDTIEDATVLLGKAQDRRARSLSAASLPQIKPDESVSYEGENGWGFSE